VCRCFLSVGEAVDALLAAGAAECHARILLPEPHRLQEPHTPVRIADLARFLIDAGGNGNAIQFTNLQPGEKLHEDLTFRNEVHEGFSGPLKIFRTCAPAPDELERVMDQLNHQDGSRAVQTMRAAVAA
jgi:FlaA1/EpsC-like NDP-sugar epimerase